MQPVTVALVLLCELGLLCSAKGLRGQGLEVSFPRTVRTEDDSLSHCRLQEHSLQKATGVDRSGSCRSSANANKMMSINTGVFGCAVVATELISYHTMHADVGTAGLEVNILNGRSSWAVHNTSRKALPHSALKL